MPGYKVFFLLGILSVTLIMISKKIRNFDNYHVS
ncbi:MAG: Loki-CTERM sorting domain-containing protein [Promethearchaeota archaeon]